ncbi:MAG: bifunctional glycosyltransferase family 2/GtrA family protein [Actinomycetota bacterium]|nr:bifunctional glycosyltransferase family 2/GtrA family protein [Actinomycetota bacterium]
MTLTASPHSSAGAAAADPGPTEPGPAIAPARRSTAGTRTSAPVLDVCIPVFNEERNLETCLRRLHTHLRLNFPHSFRITVADNASNDSTLAIAERLARELPELAVVHLGEKGRGNALRRVWLASDSPVLAYMDVDLSTDLAALPPLIAALLSGHSDIAVGTRLSHGSRVVRGARREFISRCYNLILHSTLGAHFSDAQCGFKAIRADVAARLLPYTTDKAWFFDTELLVLAERCGLRVHEVPVDWTDDPDSSVDIIPTAVADLRGIVRLTRELAGGRIPVAELRAALGRGPLAARNLPQSAGSSAAGSGPTGSGPTGSAATSPGQLFRQLVRFGAIGVVSTLAYLLIFLLCRGFLGAQEANFIALLTTAVGNTAANRRFTFGVHGRRRAARHQLEGLIVFGIGLALTSGALALLNGFGPPRRTVEILAVVGANLAATLVRFLLFRHWVFRKRPGTAPAESGAAVTASDSVPGSGPGSVSVPASVSGPGPTAPARQASPEAATEKVTS